MKLKAIPVRKEWPVVYMAAHLQFRQTARGLLRNLFEPDADIDPEAQDELFPELQSRYPIRRAVGQEPVYRKRENLTREDRDYNINRLQRQIASKQRHLDAFEAYHRRKCITEDETTPCSRIV